jgi:ABC-type Co2+ transport system permease subunit
MWEAITTWFMSIGENYGVNPLIFGAIYVGAIPFFTLAIGWLVRNYRRGRSIVLPVLAASFCFVSAYLYLAVAGHSIPLWVWVVLALMIVIGAASAVRSVLQQIRQGREEITTKTASEATHEDHP